MVRRRLRPRLAAGLLIALTLTPAGPVTAAPTGTFHEILKGDTLASIAARYGVSVRALVTANHLSSARATLRIGRRLVVPALASIAPQSGERRGTIRPQSPRLSMRATVVRRLEPLPPTLLLPVPEFVAAPPFLWPVDGALSSWYGRRRKGWHRGVDIVAEQGTAIVAAAAGVVIASGIEPRYGRVVKVEHEGGFVTVYAHNLANSVDVGDQVAPGQLIATVGRTGRATSPHLHFEIRHQGRVVNPLYLLPLPPRVTAHETTDEPDDEDE